LAKPYLEKLIERIEGLDIYSAEGVAIECKHFFSGAALYVNGNICATLSPIGFGLKLPNQIRNELIAEGDGKVLRYFDKAPIKKEYVALSQAILDDSDRLTTLIHQSMEYVAMKD